MICWKRLKVRKSMQKLPKQSYAKTFFTVVWASRITPCTVVTSRKNWAKKRREHQMGRSEISKWRKCLFQWISRIDLPARCMYIIHGKLIHQPHVKSSPLLRCTVSHTLPPQLWESSETDLTASLQQYFATMSFKNIDPRVSLHQHCCTSECAVFHWKIDILLGILWLELYPGL